MISFDTFILILAAIVAIAYFLDKIWSARLMDAKTRRRDLEARLERESIDP